jgi:hypothetical protein
VIVSNNLKLTSFDTIKFKKQYQVCIAGLPKIIDFFEMNNGDFEGSLRVVLDRKNGSEYEEIIKKIELNKELVKVLMFELEKLGIETVMNCEDNKDCIEGLDGDSTTFKIRTATLDKEYSFWELYPNMRNEKEIPKNRMRAQEILDFIVNRINLKVLYAELKKQLPRGEYSYFSGSSIYSFSVK